MIVALPMAGRGSRFEGAGFRQPKPLIPVHGVPMFIKSLESVGSLDYKKLVIIALEEHEREYRITDILSNYGLSSAELVLIPEVTKGQLCTVLAAEKHLDTDDGLLIIGSDTIVHSDLDLHLQHKSPDVEGLISVFSLPGDRWSFAKVNESGEVVQVAEKQRISDHACTGMYYFSHSDLFVEFAKEMIDSGETTKGEYYVMPLYQRLINKGYKIGISPAKAMWDLGTPDALQLYYQHFPQP